MFKESKACCANCGTLEQYYVMTQCPSCGYIGDKLPRIEIKGHEEKLLFLEFAKYDTNNTTSLSIQILEECGDDAFLEPYKDITTNIEGAEILLGENEIMVKTWSENESFIQPLLETGYFEDTGKRIRVSQYCEAAIWKVLNLQKGE